MGAPNLGSNSILQGPERNKGPRMEQTSRVRRPSTNAPTWGNSIAERLMDEALADADVPGAVLATRRPPLPQIDLWRPRMGYNQRALTIGDVLAIHRLYDDRRDAWSGGPHSWTGSPRMDENPF